jgi:hypothetical protein
MKKNTTPETDLIRAGQDAVAQLRASDERFRAEHAALQLERTELIGALAPRETVIANAIRLVDEIGGARAAEWRHTLVREIGGDFVEASNGTFRLVSPRFPYLLDNKLALVELCVLAPEAVKASLTRIISAYDFSTSAPIENRPALVAVIDARLRALEDQHEAFVEAAADVGIVLDFMPAVVTRRHHEAEQQKNQQRASEVRRELEASVNQSRASGGGGVFSTYIESGGKLI